MARGSRGGGLCLRGNAVGLTKVFFGVLVVFVALRLADADKVALAEVDGTWSASELIELAGHDVKARVSSPLPSDVLEAQDLPKAWDWRNVSGRNFLTRLNNQHLPHYCGSCWAHAAVTSLADRIKIAREGNGIDINLSVQFLLNCGADVAGSCHGGSAGGSYQLIHDKGFIPFDSCLQYEACSAGSRDPECQGRDFECSKINTCRTCIIKISPGLPPTVKPECKSVDIFPNATVAEYGPVNGADAMKAEIFARGPIACSINSIPLSNYTGGIIDNPNASRHTTHVVSILGWARAQDGSEHWIARTSWGEYFGELGHFRIKLGENQLGIEQHCYWATPGGWTEVNTACVEDGSNCVTHRDFASSPLQAVSRRFLAAASQP
ncbi:Cathepsin Z (Cathepsin P) (Cathepsin X) [Durusdinium trenchii]|uniref:Cathepsin Z (Cathepsin P) (Cathepsin X) n=1 Tax=Durusdinium trenchii TaxID=1381693 RepID=A0ABP0QTB5_9DINO